MPTLPVDAILFDMDGTLIDESRSYREAIRRTAEFVLAEPVTPEEVEEIKRLPGYNSDWDATWALIGKRQHGEICPPDDADRRSPAYRRLRSIFQTYYLGDALWRRLSGEEPPFAWDEPLMQRETPLLRPETMSRLARFQLGIATSRPRVEALMALGQHGFDRFFTAAAVVGQEDAPAEKPDPAPLLELVRRLSCTRPVYVGDTINDALAAQAAGMPFIQIGTQPFGDPLVDQQVQHRVRHVNEIVDICGPASEVAGEPA